MTVDPATPTAEQIAELARLAEACGAMREWQAHFTIHGDPMIVPTDRPYPSSRIADIATGAESDYGRAVCEFIGALDPATVLRILADAKAERAVSAGLRAEVERLRAALAAAQPTKETTSADDVAEFAAEVERRGRASFQTGAEPTP